MTWKKYKHKRYSEMRPYEPGEDMTDIYISLAATEGGSPKPGDMISRNPKNHADQWLVTQQYFEDYMEPA
jgi:hypothetical protein